MLRKAIPVILIIILLITAGVFFKDYRDQTAAASSLEAQIKNDKNSALILEQKNEALETEITRIKAETARTLASIESSEQVILPKPNSNDIVNNILILGRSKDVTVIPLSTREWTGVKIGQHNYQVFRMDVEVDGLQAQVIQFLDGLQDLENQPLVIENISLQRPIPAATPIPTPTPSIIPVSLAVLTTNSSNILSNRATLHGYLTSLGNNESVIVYFQYGESIAYGQNTPNKEMSDDGPFEALITGLSAQRATSRM